MKFILPCLLVGLFIALFSCKAHSQKNEKQTQVVLSAEDQIRESVFRYQFARWGMAAKDSPALFFIGIGFRAKDDPSSRLLATLQASTYRVKPLSQVKRSTGGVFDAKTGEKGVAFIVSSLTFSAKDKALVEATFFRNGKAGNDARYTVNSIQGRWQVTQMHLTELH